MKMLKLSKTKQFRKQNVCGSFGLDWLCSAEHFFAFEIDSTSSLQVGFVWVCIGFILGLYWVCFQQAHNWQYFHNPLLILYLRSFWPFRKLGLIGFVLGLNWLCFA